VRPLNNFCPKFFGIIAMDKDRSGQSGTNSTISYNPEVAGTPRRKTPIFFTLKSLSNTVSSNYFGLHRHFKSIIIIILRMFLILHFAFLKKLKSSSRTTRQRFPLVALAYHHNNTLAQ